MRRAVVVALAALLAQPAPLASQGLAVLSAGAVEEGVRQLGARYQQHAGMAIAAQFGTAPEIEKQLATGAKPDVLIAPAAVIERAAKRGAILTGTEREVARVGVGVVVRRGTRAPQIATADQLRAALVAAESVVYNQASTGQYLEGLFTKMGVLDTLKVKTTRYGNAAQVLEHLIASSGQILGFGPITEIKSYEPKGVVLVGPLPADIQHYTTYVAAVVAESRVSEAARRFISYLTSPAGREAFTASGAQ